VGNDGVTVFAVDIGQPAENLIVARLGARDGQVLQLAQRVDAVLRGLDYNWIGNAVSGIEPEGRRDLEAGRQIDYQAIGDVALGDAGKPSASAVDINAKFGIMRGLL